MKKTIIIILSILIIVACQKDDETIEYKVLDYKEDMALAGFVSNDSIYLCLTQTKARTFHSAFEPDNCNINISDNTSDAIVYEDGNYFCTLTPKQIKLHKTCYASTGEPFVRDYTEYYYVSHKPIQEGCNYTVSVNHKKYGLIEAQTKMPKKVNFSIDTLSVNKIIRLYIEGTGGEYYIDTLMPCIEYTLNIEDPVDVQNYYNLVYDRHYRITDNLNYYLLYRNPIFETNLGDYGLNNSQHNMSVQGDIFSDKMFNGQTLTFKFIIPKNDKPIKFKLINLNEDEYKYLITTNKYVLALSDPFSKPASIYSNVSNNIGIWGAFNSDLIQININK